MIKTFIEWFLSLFIKENETTVEVQQEEQNDAHTITVSEPEDNLDVVSDSSTYVTNEEEIAMHNETLELEVVRTFMCDEYTIGKLYVNGEYFCDTIEDADRGLTSEMSLDEIKKTKVYGKTAIPLGKYEITMKVRSQKYSNFKKYTWAEKYNGYLPRLVDVKGFDGVLMHVGNTAADSDGCLLLGYNKQKGMVCDSRKTFDTFMDKYIIPAKDKGVGINITIRKK